VRYDRRVDDVDLGVRRAALRAERDRLEIEVAELTQELADLDRHLWRASVHRPRTRGFGWGLLAGTVVVVALVVPLVMAYVQVMSMD